MHITAINVGYGDALLVQTTEHTILLDAGSNHPGEFANYPDRIRAVDYLKNQNITHLDALIVSHIHEDHVGGIQPLLEHCTIAKVITPYPTCTFLNACHVQPADDAARSVPMYAAALNTYVDLLDYCKANTITVEHATPGTTYTFSPDLTIRVLAPKPSAVSAYGDRLREMYTHSQDLAYVTERLTQLDATSNATSLLLRFETPDHVLLACGDSCPCDWCEVPLCWIHNVDVLKLPHHGQVDSFPKHYIPIMSLTHVLTTSSSDRRYNSANEQVYQQIAEQYHPEDCPQFIFTDEEEYPPWFSQPKRAQAVVLDCSSPDIRVSFNRV